MTTSTHITALGYAENLSVNDPASIVARRVPVPEPEGHDLRVEVRAVSVNPVDVKLRGGATPDEFRVLGFDAAGVVTAVGPEVTRFSVGDEVFYAGNIDRPGSNQQQQLVDERIVGHKPSSIGFADAASLPLAAITAWEALFDKLRLHDESHGTLLVVGASGGVGSVMLQLVRVLLPGVTVIGTASRPETVDWVTGLGAHHTVDHRADLASQVSRLAPGGVDWVFTAHSAHQLELYADISRPFGAVVAIDDGGRDVAPLKPKSIAWHWEFMFSRPLYTPEDPAQHELLNQVARLVDEARITPTTNHHLTPINSETLRKAHREIENGHTIGKIVLSDWQT